MSESILDSVKHAIGGITTDYTVFDDDIIMHINTAFSTLWQLGVGPAEGFSITDSSEEWSDFIDDGPIQRMSRDFVVKTVQLLFDPPQSGTLSDVIDRQLNELTFRLHIAVNPEE